MREETRKKVCKYLSSQGIDFLFCAEKGVQLEDCDYNLLDIIAARMEKEFSLLVSFSASINFLYVEEL